MNISNRGVYGKGDRELHSLMAAGLICRFKQSSPVDIYEKAMKCFDILMDILEDSDTARKVSAIINNSATKVKEAVQSIIDLLLFNSADDPYMSLCLPKHATKEQVNRRWKRLIVFYHPDKYFDGTPEHEERAKRINEAYEEIQKTTEGIHAGEAAGTMNRKTPDYAVFSNTQTARLSKNRHKYLRRLPAVVLVISLVITAASILLLIYAG